MKKKRFATLLVGLALTLPALSGCRASNDGGGAGSYPSNFSGNIPVGIIPNSPVKAYSAETKEKVYHFYEVMTRHSSKDTYVKEGADKMMEYMLSLGVGDQVASVFCDTMVSFVRLTLSGKDFDSSALLGACYDMLKVLNSIDYSKIANLMEKVNNDYDEQEKQEIRESLNNNSTIQDYYRYDLGIGSLNYNGTKELDKHSDIITSSEFKNVISQYKQAYQQYSFSEKQIQQYNDYKQNLNNELKQKHTIVPTELITFFKNQAGNLKSVLVNDLKLIVDAFADIVFKSVRNNVYRGDYSPSRARIPYDLETNDYQNNYVYLYDQLEYGRYYGSSRVTLHSVLDGLIQNRDKTIKVLKSIITDPKLADLILSFTLTFAIPQFKEHFGNDQDSLNQIEQLRQRVASLNSSHVVSLANFIVNIINQVSKEDFKELNDIWYNWGESDEESMIDKLFALGDKYISRFDNVISSLSAKDKSNILEIGKIFGFDIVAELQSLSRIYKNKNVNTEDGLEKFQDDVSEWANKIYQAFEKNFSFLYSEGNGGYKDTLDTSNLINIGNNYYIRPYLSTDNIYELSQSSLNDSIYLEIDYVYDGRYYDCIVSDSYDSILRSISDYEYAVSYGGRDYAVSLYGETRAKFCEYFSTLNVDRPSVTANTNTIGTVPYTIYMTINGVRYSSSGETSSYPRDLPTLREAYPYYSGDGYNDYIYCENEGRHHAFLRNSSVQTDDGEVLDTSKLGWNCYFSYNQNYGYYVYSLYYVYESSNVRVNTDDYLERDIGIYIEGDDDFYERPYAWGSFTCNGYEIHYNGYSSSLKFDDSYVKGKQADKLYSVTINGMEYLYVIISKKDIAETYYYFDIHDVYFNEEITKATTASASLRKGISYEAFINDMYFSASRYEEESITVTLNNLTWKNRVLSFSYDNKQFVFNYNDNYNY